MRIPKIRLAILTQPMKRLVERRKIKASTPVMTPKIMVSIVLGLAFVVGLGISVWLFNYLENQKPDYFEVTFVEPRQAVVFWKSEKATLGYVRYGTNKLSLDKRADQTASTPSEIHAVVLEDLPLEGVYVSIHTESDSIFRWRTPVFISFDPTKIE